MTPARTRAFGGAILLCYLVLGALYSVVSPVLEPPDELSHYPFVKHVADGYGLPVQRPGEKAMWAQEGSQPPLYYLLAAGLTCWIDTDDLPVVRRVNPHARIGIALAKDNKNIVIHTPDEAFPWRGTVLAVHLIRLFSVVLGAVTVWCTYRLALTVFPGERVLALGAMAITALNPQFAFISGSVNNDNLIVAIASLTLLLLARVVEQGASTRTLGALGVLCGLGSLSKLSGLTLYPLSAFALALHHGQLAVAQGSTARGSDIHTGAHTSAPAQAARTATFWQASRHWVRDCLVILVPALLVASWWYARNWTLYRDPLGLTPMLGIVGRRAKRASLGTLLSEFQGFRISYWGLFGSVNVLLRPHWIYRVLDGFVIISCAGLAVRGVQGWRRRRTVVRWRAILLVVVWVLVVCASLVRWTSVTKASQGRLTFPAIAAISLLLAWGVTAWFPRRLWPWVLGTLAAFLAILAWTAPFISIAPAYRPPPRLDLADVPASAIPFGAGYDGVARLVAYEVEPRVVEPGGSLSVTLYWEALEPTDKDLSIYIHIFGKNGEKIGQRDSYPGAGTYPTSLWSEGEVIRDKFLVTVSESAQGPVAAEVEVGLYRHDRMAPVSVTDPSGQSVGRPILTRVKVRVPTQAGDPEHALDAGFGQVRLVGFDLESTKVRPGVQQAITLYWQVTGTLSRDYTVFMHLVDAGEEIAGQGDAPPMRDEYPTSFWGSDEYLEDQHILRVREDAEPGPHQLYVGLYDPADGSRLPVLDARSQVIGDRVHVTELQVVE